MLPLVLTFVIPVAGVSAQSNSSLHLNVAAGGSIPVSSFGNRNDVGYHAAVGIGVAQPSSQLGLRIEGLYDAFNSNVISGTSSVTAITGNLTFDLNPAARGGSTQGTLYAIGGVGYYGTKEPFEFEDTQTNFGWNLGGGFRFPLGNLSAYVEARYHSVSNADAEFVPIVFGIVF